jgi:hypothetical protein
MLKECLKSMLENKSFPEFEQKVLSLHESFEDSQLEYVLGRGVTIDQFSMVFLSFDRRVGFRCTNVNQQNVGKLPICNQVEKVLNNKYVELVNAKK